MMNGEIYLKNIAEGLVLLRREVSVRNFVKIINHPSIPRNKWIEETF